MKPFGDYKRSIMIIDAAPGEAEDERGKPWQGKSGRVLKRALRELGVDLFEDCITLYACHCRTCGADGTDREPSGEEVSSCRRTTLKYIADYQPKIIILFGISAVQSVIGGRWKKDLGKIGKWRGWAIPDQDLKSWILPMFPPSYVSREDKQVETIWKQDLKRAITHEQIPFPKNKKPEITVLTDLTDLTTIGEHMSIMAFDYETTGLKPHAPGHRIICAAIAPSPDRAYTFMMPDTKRKRKPFTDLLTNPFITKMAQNMKYEDTWSIVRLRVEVKNWGWDSMQAAHVLDNRQGSTSLKFQVYVHFGVIDYASEVAPYLKATAAKEKEHGGNAINRIQELLNQPDGEKKVLMYCGWDAIWEYRLAMKQIKELDYDFLPF
jgi:uracil-DNA glycosylase family 4